MWADLPWWWFSFRPLVLPIPVTSLRCWRNHLLESFGPGTNPFQYLVRFLLTKEAKVICSRWHRGRTACFCTWTPNLSCQLGCWQCVDDVLSFASRTRSLYSIHCVAALVSVQARCHSISNCHQKWSQWSQVPSDTQLSGHVPFGCCLNPLFSPRALPHLSVSRESPFAPMWATTMLNRSSTPHWKRLLLLLSPPSQ